jgi:hypothetical protein
MKIFKGSTRTLARFGSSGVVLNFQRQLGFDLVEEFIPVARWDTVIGETVVEGDTYRPGIVAYSPNGIEKVVFTCNGVDYTVTQMALNPDTGEEEYFPSINTSGLSVLTQPVQVTAVVFDNNGEQISFEQTPAPYGSVPRISPFAGNDVRPGEVAHCFVCVESSPNIYYIAPFGSSPQDDTQTKGSAANPYIATAVYNGSAIEQLIVDEFGNDLSTIETPVEIRMLPGDYGGVDLGIDDYPVRAKPIIARWKFVNTGDRSDVVINRQIQVSATRVLYHFENITFDLSDTRGDGSEGVSLNSLFEGGTPTNESGVDSQILFQNCTITSFKLDTVRINGSFVDNWKVPVYSRMANYDIGVQYIDCLIQDSMKPDLPWSRGCRIERGAEDLTGGSFHLSMTAVDCSKVNYAKAYIDDLHQDVWQSFDAGGTRANILIRGFNIVRCVLQGPFFSGNTELFTRVAIIDCDFGLTNREPESGETGQEDNVRYIPDPSNTNTSNPGLNGTGFAVDQADEVDGDGNITSYDNEQIKDDEQQFFLGPGSFVNDENGNPSIGLYKGAVSNFYVKNCVIFSRSLIKHRGFSGAFQPVAFAGARIIFEDCFSEQIADEATGKRVLFIPGSTTANGFDDLQSFIALNNGTAVEDLSSVVDSPNLTANYSLWWAKPTPGTWQNTAYDSIRTSGATYRVTTGLDLSTQYPTNNP